MQQMKTFQGQQAELEKDRGEAVVAKVKALIHTESLETTLKEEKDRSKKAENEYQLFKSSSKAKLKYLEEQY